MSMILPNLVYINVFVKTDAVFLGLNIYFG